MCILLSSILAAEIKEIQQIKELEETMVSLKSTDWVIFDIDYTLIEPTHPALQMSTFKQNKQRFRDELASFTEEQKKIVPLLMVTQFPSRLIDPCILILIKKLQDKNIPILGLTSLDTSTVPEIGPLIAWRANELKKLGINFNLSRASPFPKERIEFNELPSFRETFPVYQEGILYCNVTPSKGAVLSAFLNKLSFTSTNKPTKVIFVDDSLENVQSVEEEMKKREIPFLGIHYRQKIDETNAPKVSDEEWRAIWDKIHDRAKRL